MLLWWMLGHLELGMLIDFYQAVSKDLSGSGVLGLVFAGVLGMLLIWDARGGRERVRERKR